MRGLSREAQGHLGPSRPLHAEAHLKWPSSPLWGASAPGPPPAPPWPSCLLGKERPECSAPPGTAPGRAGQGRAWRRSGGRSPRRRVGETRSWKSGFLLVSRRAGPCPALSGLASSLQAREMATSQPQPAADVASRLEPELSHGEPGACPKARARRHSCQSARATPWPAGRPQPACLGLLGKGCRAQRVPWEGWSPRTLSPALGLQWNADPAPGTSPIHHSPAFQVPLSDQILRPAEDTLPFPKLIRVCPCRPRGAGLTFLIGSLVHLA